MCCYLSIVVLGCVLYVDHGSLCVVCCVLVVGCVLLFVVCCVLRFRDVSALSLFLVVGCCL